MTPPRGPSKPRIRVDVAAVGDGYAVTLDGRAVKTPGKRPLVVPGAALAREIAREIERLVAEDPAALAGLGLGDPARAANSRIAAAAIDVIAGEAGARARVVADLAAYGETDLAVGTQPTLHRVRLRLRLWTDDSLEAVRSNRGAQGYVLGSA